MKRATATEALAVVQAVVAAWIAFALLVWGYGESPRAMAALLFHGTWGTAYGAGQVLFKATPLLCTGLAVDVGLRAGLFNIGAEGQLAVASLAVGLVGVHLGGLPGLVAVPLLAVVAVLTGGAWAGVPALLRARFGAHEVIGSIMMNRIADAFVGGVLASGVAVAGSVRTPDVSASSRIPRLDVRIHAFHGSAVSFALALSFGLALLVDGLFRTTRLGREASLAGKNPVACAAVGIPVARRLALAFVVSGGIAGFASLGTVLGYKGYFELGLGAGVGFGGLAVALLGRGTPLGLLVAALFFGTLQQGGLAINGYVPREVMDVLVGVVIVAVSLADASGRRALAAVPEAVKG